MGQRSEITANPRQRQSMDIKNRQSPEKETGSFFSRLISQHSQKKDENKVIDEIVHHIEPKIARVRGYRDRLREPVKRCHQHAQSLVAAIVGPIPLGSSEYHSAPVVYASFAGRERLEEFLTISAKQIEEFCSDKGELFGLMTMTREEKTTYGRKMEGNLIVGDVPMQVLNFTEHRIVGAAGSLDATRLRLERQALEVLAESARQELKERRTLVAELRDQQSRLKAMARMFGLDRIGKTGSGYLNAEQQQKRDKVKQLLAQTEEELSTAREENETPQDWLEVLVKKLSEPQKILHYANDSLHLDWRNIRAEFSDEKSNFFTLTRFTLAEELTRDAILVNIKLH